MSRIILTSNGVLNPVEVKDASEILVAGFDKDGNIFAPNFADGIAPGENLIINPNMAINQLGTLSWSIPNAGTTWTADYWAGLLGSTGSATLDQGVFSALSAEGIKAYTGLSITGASDPAAGYAFICQRIEGTDIVPLGWGTAGAKDVTISFWHANTVAGTYCMTIRNSDLSMAYIVEYTQTAGSTWEFTTVTIPGPTTGTWLLTTGIGLEVDFVAFGGSNYYGAADAWYSGAPTTGPLSTANQTNAPVGQGILISNVKLEIGDTATPFVHPDFHTELSKCQRRLCMSYDYGQFGAISTGGSVRMFNGSTGFTTLNYTYPVQMRTPPTVTAYSPQTGAAGVVRIGGGDVAATPSDIGDSHANASVGGTVNQWCYGHFVCDARI